MFARSMNLSGLIVLVGLMALPAGRIAAAGPSLPEIRVAPEDRGFVTAAGTPFIPWGVNYDHDPTGRLLEDYWDDEWETVLSDLHEIRELGFNLVRIHLQVGKFLNAADEPNPAALKKLRALADAAEREGLYLDVTGLGCYHKQDVPAWYDELSETGRWQAQCVFWSAVARTLSDSPAVFCYDLMNEPVVPGGQRKDKDWLGPAFAGKHFVQVITLDQANRPRPEIAKAWIHQLKTAIRQHDQRHLITVGLVDWSLDRPGLTSGFVPSVIGEDLDFLAVHLYPESGKLDDAFTTLKGFDIGKPILIEETFPLKCSFEEMTEFLNRDHNPAAGIVSFYWGQTPEELAKSDTKHAPLIKAWLEQYRDLNWAREK